MKTRPLPYNNNGTAPHNGTDTSADAAKAIEPTRASLAAIVFNAIENAGERGLTDAEMEAITKLSHTTGAPRRRELVLDGKVIDSGRRRENPLTGKTAKVWIAASVEQTDLFAQPKATQADVVRGLLRKKINALPAEKLDAAWAAIKAIEA